MGVYAMCVGAGRSFASFKPQESQFSSRRGVFRGLCAIAIAISAISCGDGEGTVFSIRGSAKGALVSVDKGDTTVGFARGTMRVTEKTKAFKISKSPITSKEYQACQQAHVCGLPSIDECSDPALASASFKGEDNAAVCVGRENAQKYCKWAGGRLPTLGEWLRAARGGSVQEHPWGSKRASCAQHPRSVEGNLQLQQKSGQSLPTDGCVASSEGALVTKQHPAGAASSGMQDVLITPAELLAGYEQSPFAACGPGQHCLMYGLNAGSIDTVKPYSVGSMYAANSDEAPQYRLAPEAYGFRCVIEK